MVVIVPELTGYASIRHVAVSLPYAAQLIDGMKYMLPGDVKPPEGGTERRRQRAPRAPSMRTLVRWAQKCDSAEQLGERLNADTIGNCSAAGWRRPAMPAPRPSSIVSSANLDRRPQIFPTVLTEPAPRRHLGQSRAFNPPIANKGCHRPLSRLQSSPRSRPFRGWKNLFGEMACAQFRAAVNWRP